MNIDSSAFGAERGGLGLGQTANAFRLRERGPMMARFSDLRAQLAKTLVRRKCQRELELRASMHRNSALGRRNGCAEKHRNSVRLFRASILPGGADPLLNPPGLFSQLWRHVFHYVVDELPS